MRNRFTMCETQHCILKQTPDREKGGTHAFSNVQKLLLLAFDLRTKETCPHCAHTYFQMSQISYFNKPLVLEF